MMKKRIVARFGVAVGAAAIFLASSVSFGGPTGAQKIEDSFNWPEDGFYISCLNDYLSGTVFYTMLLHTVETPSGNVHMVQSFFGTGHIYSLTTGETWTQKFSIPGVLKVGPGETVILQDREKYIPDDPHGTVFFIEGALKITVNANGELKVLRDSFTPDFPEDATRCAGKH
jgi:hypothetical protein